MYEIHPDRGLIQKGNWDKIRCCMRKAQAGEKITVGFLGGSITQGSLSSSPETCYAYLVYQWWQRTFPGAEITYVNGGIGGTTSQLGAARVETDLLAYEPDFVLVEFAVNDDNTEFFRETYEGLVRKILTWEKAPALLLMNNVRYDTGENAEEMHLAVARAYDLPVVSMKSVIWPEVKEGRIPGREITPDDLHPNDAGHQLVAEVVTDFLQKVLDSLADGEDTQKQPAGTLPAPITRNAYERAVRLQNTNAQPLLAGFEPETSVQTSITEFFKKGWIASREGDRITFQVTGSEIAVQYRKSVKQPAPIARVVIDGREEEAVLLDGNFEEDWGDCLYIDTILRHGSRQEHTVEITIVKTHEDDAVPFYLVSLIVSC